VRNKSVLRHHYPQDLARESMQILKMLVGIGGRLDRGRLGFYQLSLRLQLRKGRGKGVRRRWWEGGGGNEGG
jgi:hypothetical protein